MHLNDALSLFKSSSHNQRDFLCVRVCVCMQGWENNFSVKRDRHVNSPAYRGRLPQFHPFINTIKNELYDEQQRTIGKSTLRLTRTAKGTRNLLESTEVRVIRYISKQKFRLIRKRVRVNGCFIYIVAKSPTFNWRLPHFD